MAYIGERGARIVLVGEDGGWGDLVAPTKEIAEKAVAKAGITVHESFDGEFAAKVTTGTYEWKRIGRHSDRRLNSAPAGARGTARAATTDRRRPKSPRPRAEPRPHTPFTR